MAARVLRQAIVVHQLLMPVAAVAACMLQELWALVVLVVAALLALLLAVMVWLAQQILVAVAVAQVSARLTHKRAAMAALAL